MQEKKLYFLAEQLIRYGSEFIFNCSLTSISEPLKPQILQMSGIGPNKVLKDAGIEIKVNSEGVGAHLQDHLQFDVVYR